MKQQKQKRRWMLIDMRILIQEREEKCRQELLEEMPRTKFEGKQDREYCMLPELQSKVEMETNME